VYVPSIYPDFFVKGNLGKLYRFVVFHTEIIALAGYRCQRTIIQTGVVETKIKEELKPIKRFCQSLKGCFFTCF
jgi:hypothetical protein